MNRQSLWIQVWKSLTKSWAVMVSLIIVGIFMLIALFAPLIANNKPYIFATEQKTYFPFFHHYAELNEVDFKKESLSKFKVLPPIPYSYSEYDFSSIAIGPCKKHLLGTDDQGRDLAARMIWGTRISIFIGIFTVLFYTIVGIILGALAGYYGGIVDMLVSRLIEIVMCFPTYFLILTILAIYGSGIIKVMIVIAIVSWTGIARIVRGEFMKLRNQDFVVATKAIGARDMRIIFRHILPNAIAPVMVVSVFGIAATILTESSLSFLGLGVQAPFPSWGDTLAQSREFMDFAWWLTLIPGTAIFMIITAYNLIGEGIQEAINPKAMKKV